MKSLVFLVASCLTASAATQYAILNQAPWVEPLAPTSILDSIFTNSVGTVSNFVTATNFNFISSMGASTGTVVFRFKSNTQLDAPYVNAFEWHNAGTNYFLFDALGRVAIGSTNIGAGTFDININRVHDRGETSKAWINLVKWDTYPSPTKAGEWWANADRDNAHMELALLNAPGAITNGINWNLNTNETFFSFRMYSGAGSATTLVKFTPASEQGVGDTPFIFNTKNSWTSASTKFQNQGTDKITFSGGGTIQLAGDLLPATSNLTDIGTALLPMKTNYAKAFTVVGSTRTVAYADSGIVYLDADRFRLAGANPVTTNLSIAGVATLLITNGLVMAVAGP